ncbi:MAG: ATP-binding cassette domain-containing protein, partial [Silvanigrellaceae bacterium]|nr:ATP-binding cassette domain-containing protein [Silvanigrellaceae bacterium]
MEGLLEFCGLKKFKDYPATSLPYGLQRKLEIARSLMTEPKLLLLDEPAAGMNPTEKLALQELVKKISQQGISILLIEHDMKFVMN